MTQHALLSASGSERWLKCPPSARLGEHLPDNVSEYAEEGTFAHHVGELILGFHKDGKNKRQLKTVLGRLSGAKYYSQELLEYAQDYADYVIGQLNIAKRTCPDAFMDLERKLDYSEYAPEGFGTGDAIIIADGTMEVIDLKYGAGVPVSATDNSQLKLYALGALAEYDLMYGVDKVIMTIYQPRIDNVNSWEISVDELRAWGEEIKPIAALAFTGGGEFCVGDHCKWCKVKATCKARAEENLEMARYDFVDSYLLSDTDIQEILGKAEELKAWAKDIEDYAFQRALEGHKWAGYKLVEGRSNRKYSNDAAVETVLMAKGYEEEKIINKKLKGITDMEKLLGKKLFQELLGYLVIKPAGSPTLVKEEDKRPEI